jgi:hypothetical protein
MRIKHGAERPRVDMLAEAPISPGPAPSDEFYESSRDSVRLALNALQKPADAGASQQ